MVLATASGTGTSPVAVRYIGQGTYWLSLLLRILFFHLTTQTLLFFFQCRVSVFLWGNALIPALSACEVRTCYAHLSFFLSSKPEVYTATNKSENVSGAAMRTAGNLLRVSIVAVQYCSREITYHRPLSRRLDRCDRVIQNESRDPFGGNVYYVTMQITFLTRKFRNGERNLHCDVVHITTKWVSSLTLDCNGVFAIKAYGYVYG